MTSASDVSVQAPSEGCNTPATPRMQGANRRCGGEALRQGRIGEPFRNVGWTRAWTLRTGEPSRTQDLSALMRQVHGAHELQKAREQPAPGNKFPPPASEKSIISAPAGKSAAGAASMDSGTQRRRRRPRPRPWRGRGRGQGCMCGLSCGRGCGRGCGCGCACGCGELYSRRVFILGRNRLVSDRHLKS